MLDSCTGFEIEDRRGEHGAEARATYNRYGRGLEIEYKDGWNIR